MPNISLVSSTFPDSYYYKVFIIYYKILFLLNVSLAVIILTLISLCTLHLLNTLQYIFIIFGKRILQIIYKSKATYLLFSYILIPSLSSKIFVNIFLLHYPILSNVLISHFSLQLFLAYIKFQYTPFSLKISISLPLDSIKYFKIYKINTVLFLYLYSFPSASLLVEQFILAPLHFLKQYVLLLYFLLLFLKSFSPALCQYFRGIY